MRIGQRILRITIKNTHMVKTKRTKLSLLIVAAALTVGMAVPYVRAASYQDQINQLQAQNNSNNAAVSDLQGQATSYQDAISILQAQINQVQAQLATNQAKQTQLQGQIADNEAKIANYKTVLGDNLKALYVDGQMSSVEMLATSKNLSDYVDKEEYRNVAQNKIQTTLTSIKDLQAQLQLQKTQVEALIQDQQTQQTQLASKRADQASMLNYNVNQQADYNQKTAANEAKIQSLIDQQRRANQGSNNGAAVAGTSSYAYANWGFSMSTAPGCNDNDGPDAWGYCTRQCVSYAAWAVAHSGRVAPMYYGNANQWVSAALNNRYGSSYNANVKVTVYSWTNIEGYGGVRIGGPQPGDVAISTSGSWGHAMYVEQVSGSQIYVSQYNQALNGEFSHQWRDASDYYFLRFQ